MSTKREDDIPADMEAGMTTAERRRRRRRGAGLRVPSDNVPRRTGSHPSVAAPGREEDPNLAVSIAYSFSTDASGPAPRQADGEDLDSAPVMHVDAVPEPEVDAVPTPTPRDGARRTPTTPPPRSTSAGWSDDSEPDIKVESSPEIALDQIESEEAASGVPTAPSSNDDVVTDDGKTREMPAVNLEALGLSMGDGEPEVTEFTPPPSNGARAISQPAVSTSDAETDTTSERAVTDPSGPVAMPVEASVDIEMDEEPEAVPISRAYRRTTTVALSEEDLEELMEAEAGEREKRAGSPDAVALADDDLKDEVQAPADAADSGEILTEDLIEEVDSQSGKIRAAAAPAATDKPAERSIAPAADKPAERSSVPAAAAAAAPAVTAAAAPPPSKVRSRSQDGVPVIGESSSGEHALHKPAPPPAPKKEKAAARAAAVAAAVQTGDSKKKKKGKPWFEEIFDEDYLRTLPFLTPQATQAEARFVIETLGVEPGAQVLDLGCGYGRHAMELAARGYHVVGLDMSLPLLLRGADEAQRRGLTINFVHGDMRELDFDAQFDGAYCLFSTFGFFDDETNKKTAANLSRALKPGAKVVIEILNRDYLVGDLPTRVWWEGDGCVVLEEVEFNYFSSRIQSNRSVVFDDGRQLEQEISIRAYSLHELGKLLHSVGFRVLEVSGSIQTRGRFFGTHSRQILVVAERRVSSGKDTLDTTRG
ncbi:MAG TPA: methyltransferase domain-containing protein [Kofleriaceae bacterium]|nr:methyltransferase domain-containing protein [Kofleriaceae bacterium]